MRHLLGRSVDIRVWHAWLISLGLIALFVGLAVVVVIGLSKLGDFAQTNRNLAQANRRSIGNLARIQRIQNPTRDDFIQGALRALRAIRSCANDPACRRRNPGVRTAARRIGVIPRATRPRTSSSSGSGSGPSPGGGSGGGGTTGPGSSPSPPSSRPPRGPGSTGSRPQPTTRPSQTPANPPAGPPARPPAAQSPPAPSPRPGVTAPPVTVPPTPVTPPVTAPPTTVPVPVPLPGVCVPAVGVNCPPKVLTLRRTAIAGTRGTSRASE